MMTEGKLDPETASLKEFFKANKGRPLIEVENVHVLYESYNAENFGHFLTDELLPVYSAMSAFRVVDSNVQLLRRQTTRKYMYSCDWQIANWGIDQKTKCDHNYKEFTYLLSQHPVSELRNYSRDLQLLFGNISDNSPFLSQFHIPTTKTKKTTTDTTENITNTSMHTSDTTVSTSVPTSAASVGRGPLIVFRTVVSGMGMLADHCEDPTRHGRAMGKPGQAVHHNCNRNRQETLYSFREHTMQMAGVSTVAPRANQVIEELFKMRPFDSYSLKKSKRINRKN